MVSTAKPIAINRRQLLAASSLGGLVGAAWATSFVAAEIGSSHPTITLCRGDSICCLLIEYRSSRVLMIDGDDSSQLAEATETTLGFLRQRIDLILASDAILNGITPGFLDRWRTRRVIPLPDSRRPYQTVVDGRALVIGDMRIIASGIPLGEWHAQSVAGARPWHLTMTYGAVQCSYASSIATIAKLPGNATGGVTAFLTNDIDAVPASGTSCDLLALPAEAMQGLNPRDYRGGPEIVRLYRDYPATIHLRRDRIVVPVQI